MRLFEFKSIKIKHSVHWSNQSHVTVAIIMNISIIIENSVGHLKPKWTRDITDESEFITSLLQTSL